MNWDNGRLFLAVARAGQLLAAAKALNMNQATLGRRMNAFEKEMGTKLLVRRTTGCDLTDAGQELLKHLEKAEGAFLATQSLSGVDRDGVLGTVRIGAPDGFGSLFLAPRLAELTKRHPGLSVQLVPVPHSFSLSQREADVAVTVGRPTQGRLVARKLTDYSLSLYASKNYIATHGALNDPKDLLDHSLVGYVNDLLYAPALDFVGEFATGWQSRLEIATALGQMEALDGGAGIGIVHDFLAHLYPSLVNILPQSNAIRSYWTVVHESVRDLPRIIAVTNFLAEIVAESRGQFVRNIPPEQ